MFRPIISLPTFIMAAKEGRLSKVQQYLAANKNNPAALNATCSNGDTAFITAVMHNQEAIFDLLLHTIGINHNAANHNGNTPLITAVTYGRTTFVKSLLARPETIINARNQDGFTALGKAAMYGRVDIVKLLLAVSDIDFSIRNIFQHTAAEEAAIRGQVEIAELIKAAENARHTKPFRDVLPLDLLTCPISLQRIEDPLTLSSGVTVDRKALRACFAAQNDPPAIPCPVVAGRMIQFNELQNASNIIIRKALAAMPAQKEYLSDADEYENAACSIC